MADRSDDFNRANADLSGSTPSDGGSAWQGPAGVLVDGNELLFGNPFAWTPRFLETSTTTGRLSAVVRSLGNSGTVLRYVDANNFWLVQIQSSGLGLFKRVSGTFTQYGSTYSGTISIGDTIEIEVTAGNVWTAKQNGTLRINPGSADSAHSSATKIGAAGFSGAARYDDLVFTDTASGGGYTLTADSGSYTLTGQSASTTYARSMPADQGNYALNGQVAGMSKGVLLAADQGSYALTGQAANFARAYLVTAAQGSYTLAGQSANTLYSRLLTAAQGAYALTGQDAALTYAPAGAYSMPAGQGSYALTGQDAALRLSALLSAGQGGYTLTGQDASFSAGKIMTAAQGSYALTGQDAGFTRSYALQAAYGSYALTGRVVSLTYSGAVFGEASWVFMVDADDRLMYVGQAENAMRVPPEDDPYVVQH